jgi:hypothetical protein
MHDTFYVEGGYLLRTHTSPMQIRHAMAHVQMHQAGIDAGKGMPEIRVIAPGRTYRVDSDATHSPMFHQCEGLWIGENISFKDLKVVFTDFCKTFFENEYLVLRFRPSFSIFFWILASFLSKTLSSSIIFRLFFSTFFAFISLTFWFGCLSDWYLRFLVYFTLYSYRLR